MSRSRRVLVALVGAIATLALLAVVRAVAIPPTTAPEAAERMEMRSDGMPDHGGKGEAVVADRLPERVEVVVNGIEVRVESKANGEPLSGARIWVVDSTGSALASSVTGRDGTAVLHPDVSGDVEVIAQHRGYVPCRSKAIPYPNHTTLTFRLDVGGSVFGQVRDGHGIPIVGARLLVRQRSASDAATAWTGTVELVSDPDGRFAVEGCGPGSYSIVASHGAYIADVPVVRAVPGRPCTISMARAEVAVVEWKTSSGDVVFPRGDILLDGEPVDPGFAAERAALWGLLGSGAEQLAERFEGGQVLLRRREELPVTGGTFVCQARIDGCKPVEAVLRKWTIQDVLDGRAAPETIVLEPADSVGVHLHVLYRDDRLAVQDILPVSIHVLPEGRYHTGTRLGLQRPGEAFVLLPRGVYEVRLGYPYQTLGKHEIRVDAPPGGSVHVEIQAEKGAELVLVPSLELGPGVFVQLVGEDGSANRFDSGLFAVRSVAPITWRDMPSGRYQLRHEGLQGAWRERTFLLRQGERRELLIRP